MNKLLSLFTFALILRCKGVESLSVSKSNVRADQLEALEKFTSQLNDVLSDDDVQDNFVSFVLKGNKSPSKTKQMSSEKRTQIDLEKDRLRGQIREISCRLILLSDKNRKGSKDDEKLCVQATVKYHGATDIAKNFEVKGFGDQLFNLLYPKSSSMHSCDNEPSMNIISEWGVTKHDLSVQSGELITRKGKWQLIISEKRSYCKFSRIEDEAITSDKIKLSHDKPKNTVLSSSELFFQKLGVTDENGKPKANRSSKLRQCQKFVEIVSRLVDDSRIFESGSSTIRILDMGCGRGYLTFSLHSYLSAVYQNIVIQSIGVDVRPKLMTEVSDIARDLGNSFSGLSFKTGTIDSVCIEGGIDILVALHACDTATDDSIFYGIKKGASIIVSAPCCHKEIRRYLDLHVAKIGKAHPYGDILRYNIYKERLSETVTDSIRALLLEIADYDVQVFEFIGGEHTAKNVMVCGVKRTKLRTDNQKMELRGRLHSLCQLHGIKDQKLAILMGEILVVDDGFVSKSLAKSKRSAMPPM